VNSRERVMVALSHREPDRVPFDFNGTTATMIAPAPYCGLRKLLGLGEQPIELADTAMQMAVVHNDLLNHLGADARQLRPRPSYAAAGAGIMDSERYLHYHDEWGIGWRMPRDGGLYFDMYDSPLRNLSTLDEVARYPWPDPAAPERFVGLAGEAKAIHEQEGRAVALTAMSAGLFETAAYLMGFESFYVALLREPQVVGALLDKILESKLVYWDRVLRECGEYVDVVCEDDDLAGQSGPLISPGMYRRMIKPRHRELFSLIKKRCSAPIWFHCCGAVRELLPDLIDVGVEVLNPIQVSATGMDTSELKKEYGKDLAFWGGGVDTQRVLAMGTQEQVRQEVRRRITDLMPGGGWIFATVHNIQADVPPENIIAMWETLREYGSYSA
jgi:uroporphyrinogen decarboxylase